MGFGKQVDELSFAVGVLTGVGIAFFVGSAILLIAF